MKNKYGFGLGALLTCGMIAAVNAAPVRNAPSAVKKPVASGSKVARPAASSTITRRKTNDVMPIREKRFYIFAGVDLGLAMYAQSDVPSDASRTGLNVGVRGLLGWYTNQWVVDGGLGFALLSTSGTNLVGRELSVTTRTLFLDLSPRYRLDEHWQIGPEAQFWLGTDNGLNANIFSSDTNNAFLGGLQVLREWGESTKYRLGGRWNMDFNAPDRNLNVFQVFFQIDLGALGGSRDPNPYVEEMRESDVESVEALPTPAPVIAPEPTPEPTPQPTPEPEVMSTPAPVEEVAPLPIGPQEKMVITLDVQALPFESNSARLPKYNRDRVQEIGRFLGEHKEDWQSLVVSGHTDAQGNKAYNLKLSKARADTVRQLLGEGGAPIQKIKSVGMGATKPLDRAKNKKAWAKNRRVELEFKGVKDGLVIQNAFK